MPEAHAGKPQPAAVQRVGGGSATATSRWRAISSVRCGVEHARLTAGLRQALGPNSLIQVDFGQPALYGTDFGSRDTLNVVTVLVKTYI